VEFCVLDSTHKRNHTICTLLASFTQYNIYNITQYNVSIFMFFCAALLCFFLLLCNISRMNPAIHVHLDYFSEVSIILLREVLQMLLVHICAHSCRAYTSRSIITES